jgi:hypothetical protein
LTTDHLHKLLGGAVGYGYLTPLGVLPVAVPLKVGPRACLEKVNSKVRHAETGKDWAVELTSVDSRDVPHVGSVSIKHRNAAEMGAYSLVLRRGESLQ